MNYVLLVIVLIAGNAVITMQDFTSLDHCEAATKKISSVVKPEVILLNACLIK